MNKLVLHVKGEPSFITYIIKKKLNKNLNFIGMITGATGIGKTYNGIKIAHHIDPEFDAEKQITFDFKETMKAINSDWLKNKKRKVIVFDEPQISISNRAWQSITNKLMNFLLSTFRNQNIVLLFCAPYMDFLDSQSMKLLHGLIECQGVNTKTNTSTVRPKLLQYNQHTKKTYQHALRVIHNGKVKPLRVWKIKKPLQEHIDIYERRKTEFTTRLNKEILEELENIDKPKKTERDSKSFNQKPLTELQEKILDCWMRGVTNQTEIGKEAGKPQGQISENESYMRRKGYYKAEYTPKS